MTNRFVPLLIKFIKIVEKHVKMLDRPRILSLFPNSFKDLIIHQLSCKILIIYQYSRPSNQNIWSQIMTSSSSSPSSPPSQGDRVLSNLEITKTFNFNLLEINFLHTRKFFTFLSSADFFSKSA